MSEADENRDTAEGEPEESGEDQGDDELNWNGPDSKDTHELGADEAKAYIPPTALAPKKPVPKLDDQKVRLADELNPRAVRTQPSVARQNALDAQGSVPPDAASSPGDAVPDAPPSSPVNQTGEMVAVDPESVKAPLDDALPFVKPGASNSAPSPAASQPEGPAEAAAAPAQDEASDVAEGAGGDEEGGPSPWSAEEKLDAELLPSAAMEFPSAGEAEEDSDIPSTPPDIPMGKGGSRTMLVFLLGLAAVVLVGAIIYMAVGPDDEAEDGPAAVEAGAENRQYGDETTATATASATDTPTAEPTTTAPPSTSTETETEEATTTTTKTARPKGTYRPPRRTVDIYGDLD